jgi:hypothetical protein
VHFLEVCDPGIRLCIATSTTTQQTETTTTEFEDWCLEHQFDYVDMKQQEVETPMDKVGYDLVVDALHTNMWEGLTRKDGQRKQQLPDVFGPAAVDTNENDEAKLKEEMEEMENMDDDEWIKGKKKRGQKKW